MKRVPLAIVATAPSPYRFQQHRRFANELPEIDLTSVLLHEYSVQNWNHLDATGIGLLQFGHGEGVVWPRTPGRLLDEWRKGGEICAELEHRRVRAVVVCGYASPALARVMRWARAKGIPSLLWADSNARGDVATGLRRQAKEFCVRRAVAWCSGVLAAGTLGRQYFLRYGADPERVWFCPYEPDIRRLGQRPRAAIDDALRRHGLDPARRRFVCSGQLVPARSFDTAIRAFSLIAARRPDWDLVFVGGGDLQPDLQLLVGRDLAQRVKWCGFVDDPDDLAGIYRGSHVLVHPARFEPWGVCVHEAAAAGMAVLASDVTGSAVDIVVPGQNGWLVPPASVDILAQRMEEISEPGALARARGAAGPTLAQWYRTHDPVAGLFRALAGVGVVEADEARAVAIAEARAGMIL